MASGQYNHPAYLVRMPCPITSKVGNGSTSGGISFPWAVVIRNASANVLIAGTSTGYGVNIMNGTSSVGTIALSTSAIGVNGTAGDMNTKVPQGTNIALVNTGTDATGQCVVNLEVALDPAATWPA